MSRKEYKRVYYSDDCLTIEGSIKLDRQKQEYIISIEFLPCDTAGGFEIYNDSCEDFDEAKDKIDNIVKERISLIYRSITNENES